MILEKALAICFSFGILFQAWFVGLRAGTWMMPASVFGIFWFLYSFIPLVALPSVPVNPWAIGYIFLGTLAFSFSAYCHVWRPISTARAQFDSIVRFDTPFLNVVFWACTLTTLVAIFINWGIQGITLNGLLFNLFETAGSIVDRKYRGLLVPNFFATLAVVLVYPSVIMGGLIFGDRYKIGRRKRILLFSLMPAVLVMLAEGNKGSLPLVLVLFWASVLVSRLNRGEVRLLGPGFVRQGFFLALFFFPIVIIAFLARGLSGIDDFSLLTDLIMSMFASYMFGHIYAFSDWFSAHLSMISVMNYDRSAITGGFFTFMPIYELFAEGRDVPAGIYSEYFSYQEIFQTNIYTAFRGLILDFGLLGGLIVLGFLGLIANWVFVRICYLRSAPISTAIYIHVIGFCYASFIISLLIWNSIYASIVLTSVVLAVNTISQTRFLRRESP